MLKKIIVVEDEPASLECLGHFLRKEGYRVSEARDGGEFDGTSLRVICRR
jgi:DNA-binding response OmpR family regulator